MLVEKGQTVCEHAMAELAGVPVDGAGAIWITVRRLRTPVRKLPRGVRVA